MPSEMDEIQNEKLDELIEYLAANKGRKVPDKLEGESPTAKTVNALIDRAAQQANMVLPASIVEPLDESDDEGTAEALEAPMQMLPPRFPFPSPEYPLPELPTFWAKITQEASGGGGEYDGWAQQRLDDDGAWEDDSDGYSSANGDGSLFEATATTSVPLNTVVLVHEEYETDAGRRFVFSYDMSADEKVKVDSYDESDYLENQIFGATGISVKKY